MKTSKLITAGLILSFINMSFLPAFAINDTKATKKAQVKQEKMLKHKVKRSKKYNDDYKYGYVNLDFWKSFNDTNLNNYIDLAIKNNYDLKMATLNVDEFYQAAKIQLADELPQGGIGFSPAYAKAFGMGSDWNFSFPMIINYEADIFLKNRDKTRSAKKLYEGSQYDERAAYISVASAVGTVYFNLMKLDNIIASQEEIVNLRKQIYEIMLESNKEGLVSTSDTVKANKSYVYGNSELIEYKKERTKLLHQLAVLIGESPDNINNLKISKLDDIKYSKTIPSEISSEIITNRPDYLKSVKMLEKYGLDVRVAKKEFLPTINLSGLAFFMSEMGGSGLFNTNNGIYAIAASAMLPVFTGGKRIANLKLKKVQYDKMLENYHKTNLTAIQEVNDALVSVKRDDEKLKEHTKQLKLETQDFGYTQKRYNEGIISKLDLIQMKENLLTVNQLVASSKVDCYVDYISLYKAVGSKL
jgi:NodT family efflux transporter outer membrane factor (OMF) lipoprotein